MINTFYIANNKTKQASILQTEKTRDDIWLEVENSVDIVKSCPSTEHAQNLIVSMDMEYVPYDTFIK